MTIDYQIFSLINGLAGRWGWLDFIGIFLAVYLGYLLLFVLGVLLIKDFKKYWRMVLEAVVVALIVRFVIVEAFYLFWFRQRPFLTHYIQTILIQYDPKATSFPSGHASFYFALST